MAIRYLALFLAAVLIATVGPVHRADAQDTFVVVPDAPGGAIFTVATEATRACGASIGCISA